MSIITSIIVSKVTTNLTKQDCKLIKLYRNGKLLYEQLDTIKQKTLIQNILKSCITTSDFDKMK